jgi:amino acid transporter
MAQEHKMGLSTALIISINSMIGAGIFSVPIQLATQAGPAGLATYALVAGVVLLIALALSRTAATFPGEGSFYHYAHQWGGHEIGLLAAGCYITGLVIALGLLTGLAGTYLHTFIPGCTPFTLSLILLALLTIANCCNLTIARFGNYLLACCTIIPLIITTIWCFFHARLANITPFMTHSLFDTLAVCQAIVFGFFGFESSASLFALVKNPKKTVPQAITASLILVSILYILFTASLMLALPLHAFTLAAEQNLPLTIILKPLFIGYEWLLSLLNLSITTALLGVLYSMIFSCSRLLVSLSKKAHAQKREVSPRKAVLIISSGILFCVSTLSNPNLFFSLTALFILTAFSLSIASLAMRKKERLYAVPALIATLILCSFSLYRLAGELNKHFILHYEKKECRIS